MEFALNERNEFKLISIIIHCKRSKKITSESGIIEYNKTILLLWWFFVDRCQ